MISTKVDIISDIYDAFNNLLKASLQYYAHHGNTHTLDTCILAGQCPACTLELALAKSIAILSGGRENGQPPKKK